MTAVLSYPKGIYDTGRPSIHIPNVYPFQDLLCNSPLKEIFEDRSSQITRQDKSIDSPQTNNDKVLPSDDSSEVFSDKSAGSLFHILPDPTELPSPPLDWVKEKKSLDSSKFILLSSSS